MKCFTLLIQRSFDLGKFWPPGYIRALWDSVLYAEERCWFPCQTGFGTWTPKQITTNVKQFYSLISASLPHLSWHFQVSSQQTQQPSALEQPGVFTGSKVSFISGWYPSFLCLLLKLKAFFVPVWRKSRISGRQEGLWLGPKTRQSVTSKSIKTPVTNLMKWHASGLATSTYWAAQRRVTVLLINAEQRTSTALFLTTVLSISNQTGKNKISGFDFTDVSEHVLFCNFSNKCQLMDF